MSSQNAGTTGLAASNILSSNTLTTSANNGVSIQGSNSFTLTNYQPKTNLTLSPSGNEYLLAISYEDTEIFRLDYNGKSTWKDGIQVDRAAEAFSRAIQYGITETTGLNKTVRRELRMAGWDAAFEEIIRAVEAGRNLDTEELTYMRDAIKILDKLSDS